MKPIPKTSLKCGKKKTLNKLKAYILMYGRDGGKLDEMGDEAAEQELLMIVYQAVARSLFCIG
jgi:hypothetical protein